MGIFGVVWILLLELLKGLVPAKSNRESKRIGGTENLAPAAIIG
jgi:hypothetical protein